MASSYYICHLWEETGTHLLFPCRLANALWSRLLDLCRYPPPTPSSVVAIWNVIFDVGDLSGRATAIFFHAISIIWLLWNDAKHNNQKPTLQRAKVIFEDRIKGMIISLSTGKDTIHPHPIFIALGLVWSFGLGLVWPSTMLLILSFFYFCICTVYAMYSFCFFVL